MFDKIMAIIRRQTTVEPEQNIGRTINEIISGVVVTVVALAIEDARKCRLCGRRLHTTKAIVYYKKIRETVHGKCLRRFKENRWRRKHIRRELKTLAMLPHEGAFNYICDRDPYLSLKQRLGLLVAILEGVVLCGGEINNRHVFFEQAVRLIVGDISEPTTEEMQNWDELYAAAGLSN